MKRNFGLVLLVGVLLPLTVVANASAQGGTMQVSTQTVNPGQTINVKASSFSSDTVRSDPAQIRLDKRTAPSLRSAAVAGDGTVDTDVTIPASTPLGWHLLIATQRFQGGNQRSFGPARVRILVVRAAGGAGAPGRSPGSGPVAPLGLGLALVLLLAGVALTARRHRRLPRPLGS